MPSNINTPRMLSLDAETMNMHKDRQKLVNGLSIRTLLNDKWIEMLKESETEYFTGGHE